MTTMTETKACPLCDNWGSERPRFFQRQVVNAADLTQDQSYFLEKLRRHNRLLHGWGVVCGARCKQGQGDCEVVIEPGYILGPYGDEIVIDREVTINVCTQDLDGNAAGPCGAPTDPWCSNVRVDRRAGDKLYVAVRYAECHACPVRVVTGGCGCEREECEYSRIRDSYAFRVLTTLPATYTDPLVAPDPKGLWKCDGSGRPCPPCPAEPWVILADVTLASDGKIGTLDCFAHRRYVVSFADFYFVCTAEKPAPKVLRVQSVRIHGPDPSAPSVPLTDPKTPIQISTGMEATTIEVVFDNADLDAASVVAAKSFKVVRRNDNSVVNGKIVRGSNANTLSWLTAGRAPFPADSYRVTISGSGNDAVKSTEGVLLDGEPSNLPSGDGKAGGDFTFDMDVISVIK